MKRIKILFLLLFFGGSLSAEAQGPDVSDTARLRCTYSFKFLTDTTTMDYQDDEQYIVQIGENLTKSFCYRVFYVDSLNSMPGGRARRQADFEQRLNSMPSNPTPSEIQAAIQTLYRGTFQFYVYKNHRNAQITVVDNISSYTFFYEEELMPLDWTITEDTMTILDYTCQRATCSFRGREWEAWFTPEIPIDEGPWKFHGLPGLIMKLEDTESHYRFEMIGLQQVEEPIRIFVHRNARKVDRLTFLNLKMNRTGTDLAAMDMAKVGLMASGEPPKYDHIERDYK